MFNSACSTLVGTVWFVVVITYYQGYVMSGSTCYKYINIFKNHEEAEDYCRQVLNAQLPVVNNS